MTVRAGAAVGHTNVPRVRGETEAAIRSNLHVEGKHAYPEIELAVGHLLPVNIKPGDLVDRTLRGQCVPPVGRDGHSRDAIAHGHRVDELDLLAVDREYADRIVGAIGDQDEVAVACRPRRWQSPWGASTANRSRRACCRVLSSSRPRPVDRPANWRPAPGSRLA